MEVEVNHVKIAFVFTEPEVPAISGGKAPIILLHGATNSKETWKTIILPLAFETGRKVYAYDARNHGDSEWSDGMSYPIMVDDLLKFMDSLHAERAILIGHSMGGKVALHFALKWPERVETLIVEDISPKPVAPKMGTWAIRYVQLLQHAIEQLPEGVKDLTTAKNFLQMFVQERVSTKKEQNSENNYEINDDESTLPLTQDENGRFRWKANLKAIEECFLKVPQSPMPVHGSYPNPTLFIWGKKSPYKVAADCEFILEHFPNAIFRGVEGASHYIHQDFEEVFLKEVVHFINEAR